MASEPPPGSDRTAGLVRSKTFHLYSRLPFELRRLIWKHYLAEATSQVYRFELRYARHPYTGGPAPWSLAFADATIILQPRAFWRHVSRQSLRDRCALGPFIDATALTRTAAATCTESRMIALEVFPHSLTFRHLPRRWMNEDRPRPMETPQGDPYPEYILRFNGAKDIILFHAYIDDQISVADIVQHQGQTPESFHHMSHVGITASSLRWRRTLAGNYGLFSFLCRHTSDACRDACVAEPLVRFLSCFPALKTFYVAEVDEPEVLRYPHLLCRSSRWDDSNLAQCLCPESSRTSDESQHLWPTVRMADMCTPLVIYDEHSSCCTIPKIKVVEKIRESWRPHFPYYQVLKHLDIKFMVQKSKAHFTI